MVNWINLIGMLIDLYGFIMVYKIKIGNHYTIDINNFSSRHSYGGEITPEETIRDFISELNGNTNKVNAKINADDKKAKKYFYCILVGFLIQLLSVCISIGCVNQPPTISKTNNCGTHK